MNVATSETGLLFETTLLAGTDLTFVDNILNVDNVFLRNTGDVNIGGNLTIQNDYLEMATNTAGALLIADGGKFKPVAVSGDITVNSSGLIQFNNDSVETRHIEDAAITNIKVANAIVSIFLTLSIKSDFTRM